MRDLLRPCVKCGKIDRYPKTGVCRPCSNKRAAVNRTKPENKAKLAVRNAKPESKVKHNKQCALWYAANSEKIAAENSKPENKKKLADRLAARMIIKTARGECKRCPNPAVLGKTLCVECSIKDSARVVTRRKNHIPTKIRDHLRHRLYMAIKNGAKSGSAVRDLGCTIAALIIYLAQKFQPGMTWDNWGNGIGKWNIDHIIPFAAINVEDREQLLTVLHYTNLQPLWAEENLKKGGR